MKKFILGIIVGIIITGSIAGVVAYNYSAKDVSYTPNDSNWNVSNVEGAIKDLYKNRSFNFSNVETIKYQGSLVDKKQISKQLSKGKYVILVLSSISTLPSSYRIPQTNDSINITVSCNNCVTKKIMESTADTLGTSTVSGGSYLADNYELGLYEINVTESTDNIVLTGQNYGNSNANPQNLFMYIMS